MRILVGTLTTVAALAVGASFYTSSRQPTTTAPSIALTPCHIGRLAEELRCGVYRVRENRHAPTGRAIDIHVAVLPALRRQVAPDPLLVFAGGPGQGARDYVDAVDRFFRKVRRSRDIVLIDLRGTGASHPLMCRPMDDDFAVLVDADAVTRHAEECLEALDADPRLYTHAQALADVDDIRQQLGYQQVNIWGGSWGTRAALLYALRYPAAVRSVTLDGAVPLAMEFPRPASGDAQRAFALLTEQCRADPACLSTFPDPAAELEALVRRLDAGPLVARVRHPRTGSLVDVKIPRDAVLDAVRGALYVPQDAVLVLPIVRRALEGDVAPLLAQALRTASATTDEMAIGATMAILCSEDLPVVSAANFETDAAGSIFGTGYADAWRSRCRNWPAGPALDDDRAAVAQSPALIVSGEHDPVTPPRWGEAMGRHFRSHWHVAVPGAAHNASFTGCVPDLIAAFIAYPDGTKLDTDCVVRPSWPAIVLGTEGPRP